MDEATWIDEADFRGQFLEFSLEDKAVSNGGGIDEPKQSEEGPKHDQNERGRNRSKWKVYSRKSKVVLGELAYILDDRICMNGLREGIFLFINKKIEQRGAMKNS